MAIKYRLKCPQCGEVINTYHDTQCPKCRNNLYVNQPAMLQLYRKGNFYGMAGSFGIYLNGEPYGYIGNRESLKIPLPYGNYNLHIAIGISRKCNDLLFTLSPNVPVMYAKTYIKPGFWTNSFGIEVASPDEMPVD